MKILHVIFSCNRIKYLTRTIESLEKLNYGNHQVDRLIIDDYPRTRNDFIFDLLSKTHNFSIRLNKENLGLSVNWSEFFNWLKTTDYDYVLHQEDDVVLTNYIKLDDLLTVLESDANMASVVLQRQPWYFREKQENKSIETQFNLNDLPYWWTKNTITFPIIFTLYRKNITEYPFQDYWKFNLNEGMIMVYLEHFHKMYAAQLSGPDGQNLIEHIGEESTGRRILEGEPNWDQFSHMDPNKMYSSRTGTLIE